MKRWFPVVSLIPGIAISASLAWSAIPTPPKAKLSDRLTTLRSRVIQVEQELINALKTQKEAKSQILKIKILMKLQKEERDLTQARLKELESTIGELESRRGVLKEKISIERRAIRKSLAELSLSLAESPRSLEPTERERIDPPRRYVLSKKVDRGLKEIEVLKVDLADADHLEARILEERQQLNYVAQDLKEQESILAFNQQLQSDLLKQKHAERVSQLENYRKLKSAEAQVESLISEFNSRRELEKAVESERATSRMQAQLGHAQMTGEFAKRRGKLPWPVSGKVISGFGRHLDLKSNLYVFKKGIDILGGSGQSVAAIAGGKVAFSGELPDYGKVTIIDHGEHFYSLCAHLGELLKKVGESVTAGDSIGRTDDSGTAVYFEIRARNVAVNPLQWVSN